jgi:hypothetical protein
MWVVANMLRDRQGEGSGGTEDGVIGVRREGGMEITTRKTTMAALEMPEDEFREISAQYRKQAEAERKRLGK